MRLILASRSVSRKNALEVLGLDFVVKPSDFDEKSIRLDDPLQLAIRLGEEKAKAFSDEKESVIVAGDLFCVFEGEIYEKPADNDEGYRMLKSFSGKPIEVVTSVCVFNTKTGEILSGGDTAVYEFREISDDEIWDYINTHEVTHYAAAFNDEGVRRFSKTPDPFPHAFPMDILKDFLKKMGILIPNEDC